MGQYAANTTHRGADVTIRLYRGGQPLDIIEAEEIEWAPVLVSVDSAPLSLGYTQHDVHVDNCEATVKGVKKGNAFLQEVMTQVKASQATGKPLPKYTAVINYRDLNTNTVQPLKIGDASMTAIDAFASGAINAAQHEGFKLVGLLK